MVKGLIVQSGVVVNVAVFETENEIFEGWILCPDGVGMNFTDNDDGTFTATTPVVE